MTEHASAPPLLSFSGFRKRYGEFLVLETESLELQAGIHLLIGPNGSGKTTLMKALSGMIAFEGDILLDGTNLKQEKMMHRRWVNYCEAEPIFPTYLTGTHLIELYRESKNGSEEQVERIREILGIGDYLSQPVGTYSSGMKKKLALLLALLGNPKLILLDEPLTTLDPKAQPQLVALIREYVSKGVSFILSSHQQLGLDELEMESALLIQEKKIEAIAHGELEAWFGIPETEEI